MPTPRPVLAPTLNVAAGGAGDTEGDTDAVKLAVEGLGDVGDAMVAAVLTPVAVVSLILAVTMVDVSTSAVSKGVTVISVGLAPPPEHVRPSWFSNSLSAIARAIPGWLMAIGNEIGPVCTGSPEEGEQVVPLAMIEVTEYALII